MTAALFWYSGFVIIKKVQRPILMNNELDGWKMWLWL